MNDPVHLWEAELARLEADLADYEALLASPDSVADPEPKQDWAPPAGLGPLPAELLPRARTIVEQQQQLRARLVRALGDNTRQRGFAARVTDATVTRATPAYLDVSA